MDPKSIRTAVVFEADAFDRKGLFNAVHGRIKALEALGGYSLEPWCILCKDTPLARRVRHLAPAQKGDELEVEGVRYRLLRYRFSLLDWLLVEKLHCRPLFWRLFLRRAARRLAGRYDLISAHSLSGGLLAMETSRRSPVPFFVTWHGSDIHTNPGRNPLIRRETAALSAAATGNFYVSEALMEAAAAFPGQKYLLRNGVDKRFYLRTPDERRCLREEYELQHDARVVAYAGHFFHVKNTLSLPDIWGELRRNYEGPLVFWLIGDGKEAPAVRARLDANPDLDWVGFGNRDPGEMPRLLSCVDVLVLPSFNEGLPLIAMEALSCGCRVVGSLAGGIPEVIGRDHCVPMGADFAAAMTRKITWCLQNPRDQKDGRDFSWTATAEREYQIYRECLNSSAK